MSRITNIPVFPLIVQRLPANMVDRVRLLVLVLAISSTVAIWPAIIGQQNTTLSIRLLQIVLLVAIFWRWQTWYRQGTARLRDLVLELPVLALLTYYFPEPGTALTFAFTGVYLRPLLSTNRQTVVAAIGYASIYVTAASFSAPGGLSVFDMPILTEAATMLIGAAIVRTLGITLERSVGVMSHLERAERRYRTLVEQLPGIVITFDESGVSQYVSPRMSDVLGYSPEQYLANKANRFRVIHRDDRDLVKQHFEHSLRTGEPMSFECRVYHANGEVRWVRFEANRFQMDDGSATEWRGIITETTQQHEMAEELAHLAYHDALTGLPNRALFESRLELAISRHDDHSTLHAVLFLDLDNFKVVNDSLGHNAGDKLLITAAERITARVRSGDIVARLGGDEFAVLLQDLPSRDTAHAIADDLCGSLAIPFPLSGYPAYVSASIGIAFSDSSRQAPEDLVRQADVAMYEAKQSGKSRYAVFQPGMDERAWERLQIEVDIRSALERHEFVVCYQPVVDLQSGKVSEVEALVRWIHPVRGELQPADFLPMAEEIGMMARLDTWVLETACAQTRAWQLKYPEHRELIISVNMSPALLQNPTLAIIVESILRETGLPPRNLRLEVTENTMLSDIERAMDSIKDLHELGVRIAVDDFGTGNSALGYLRRLPIDTLKIDRSYVADIHEHPDGLKMLRSIIQLARSLGLSVTVEGIEHPVHLCLQELGCDHGQGFFFARPLQARNFEEVLEDGGSFKSQLNVPTQCDIALQEPIPTLAG